MTTTRVLTPARDFPCFLCARSPSVAVVGAPIGVLDTRVPRYVCAHCWEPLHHMLSDVPWLRYQVSQYRTPQNGTRGYANGYWVGDQ